MVARVFWVGGGRQQEKILRGKVKKKIVQSMHKNICAILMLEIIKFDLILTYLSLLREPSPPLHTPCPELPLYMDKILFTGKIWLQNYS